MKEATSGTDCSLMSKRSVPDICCLLVVGDRFGNEGCCELAYLTGKAWELRSRGVSHSETGWAVLGWPESRK